MKSVLRMVLLIVVIIVVIAAIFPALRYYRYFESHVSTDDAYIDASDLECKVQDGEVTLAGTVPDRETKYRVEDLVESIAGVTEVQINLRVVKR